MKFEIGYYYKLRERNHGLDERCHILHVTRKKDGIYYQIDQGIPYKVDPDNDYDPYLDDMKIIKRSQIPIPQTASRCKIIFQFYDEDGDSFEFTANNRHAARQIVNTFPAIDKGLGRN